MSELERGKGDIELMLEKDRRALKTVRSELEEALKSASSERDRAKEAER